MYFNEQLSKQPEERTTTRAPHQLVRIRIGELSVQGVHLKERFVLSAVSSSSSILV